jgi:transcriptional regulator with XRE-family HTH domain
MARKKTAGRSKRERPTEKTRATEDIGARLQAIRTMVGLSQRELAKRAGVTNGMISLIEQNRVSPSISSLKKVLDGIPMSLADFFTMDLGANGQIFFHDEDLPDLGSGKISFRLVGFNRHNRAMSILHERYHPGADTGEEMLSHAGEEGGVVVQGSIELTVGGQKRMLAAGDAYYFESRLPHRFRNVGDDICEVISANSPPTF